MAIYLKLDSIKGSVTDSAFKDQIECQSFQFGAGVSVASARGGDRTASEPSVSEITVTKQLDKASEGLFKSLLKGESIGSGTISFTSAAKGESVAFATIDLSDVIISGFSQSTGGDIPTESVSINISKFTYTFNARDMSQGASPSRLVYDLSQNKVG